MVLWADTEPTINKDVQPLPLINTHDFLATTVGKRVINEFLI